MGTAMNLADHIDNTLRSYAKSASFRGALHSETPGARTHIGICPPEHPHGATGHCYSGHKCRCGGCREGSSKRQKQGRMRRARAAWEERQAA